ncbi:unnamed protein product, partial [Rotaria magnacalcarata]
MLSYFEVSSPADENPEKQQLPIKEKISKNELKRQLKAQLKTEKLAT